jgi:hypothetical protein
VISELRAGARSSEISGERQRLQERSDEGAGAGSVQKGQQFRRLPPDVLDIREMPEGCRSRAALGG